MKKPTVAIRLVSSLLCIIMCLSLMAGILIADIRIATTKENTAKIIRETLFATQTVRPAGVSGTGTGAGFHRTPIRMARVKLEEESGVMTEALVDWLYDSLRAQFGDSLPVSQETVEAFIEESTLKDEIADLGASLINDFITGENTTTIDESTIRSLMEENAALIETYFGVTITEDTINTIAANITSNDYVGKLQEEGIGGLLLNSVTGNGGASAPGDDVTSGDGDSSGTGAVAELLTTFRQATSISAIIACFGVAAVCMAALILLSLKFIWYALRQIGVTIIIASLPSVIPTFMAMLSADLWTSIFASMSIVGNVLGMILKITAPLCISAFAVGVVLIVLSIILKRSAKKKAALATTATDLSDALIEEEPAAEEPAAEEEPESI